MKKETFVNIICIIAFIAAFILIYGCAPIGAATSAAGSALTYTEFEALKARVKILEGKHEDDFNFINKDRRPTEESL